MVVAAEAIQGPPSFGQTEDAPTLAADAAWTLCGQAVLRRDYRQYAEEPEAIR